MLNLNGVIGGSHLNTSVLRSFLGLSSQVSTCSISSTLDSVHSSLQFLVSLVDLG